MVYLAVLFDDQPRRRHPPAAPPIPSAKVALFGWNTSEVRCVCRVAERCVLRPGPQHVQSLRQGAGGAERGCPRGGRCPPSAQPAAHEVRFAFLELLAVGTLHDGSYLPSAWRRALTAYYFDFGLSLATCEPRLLSLRLGISAQVFCCFSILPASAKQPHCNRAHSDPWPDLRKLSSLASRMPQRAPGVLSCIQRKPDVFFFFLSSPGERSLSVEFSMILRGRTHVDQQ